MRVTWNQYLAHLRSGAASAGSRGAWGWGVREQAKVLVPAGLLVLVVAAFGMTGWLAILLLGIAATIALVGMAAIILVGASYELRAEEKRYSMFTREKLSAEYRDEL